MTTIGMRPWGVERIVIAFAIAVACGAWITAFSSRGCVIFGVSLTAGARMHHSQERHQQS